MERFGLVGLPNAGKTSLFNTLTGAEAPVAAHPFSTTETNIGTAKVPDKRLERLAEMSRSRKVVHATAEFVDIAGLQKGSAQGEGLGNRFLGGIREVDAICYVLRAFSAVDVAGGNDPLDDLATLELELVLADVASAETQIDRRRKAARSDKSLSAEVGALERAVAELQAPRRCTGRASDDELRVAAPVLPADRQADARRGQPRRGPSRATPMRSSLLLPPSSRRRRGARRVGAARGRGGASSTRASGASCSRASVSVRARCPGSSARRITCSACARSSRRATRRAGRGRSAPAPRRRSAPASSTATSNAGSSGPR